MFPFKSECSKLLAVNNFYMFLKKGIFLQLTLTSNFLLFFPTSKMLGPTNQILLTKQYPQYYSGQISDIFQSGFRSQHSTESALVKVVSDLLFSGDSGSLSILLLLDLRSDFDTVCHKILLSRLAEFGISGSALSWFSSNFTDRQYYISLHNSKSPTVSLKQGVPQGSVLRLLRFILYIQPLGQIMHHHGFNHHCSADDIQYILLVNQILPIRWPPYLHVSVS